MVGTHSHAAGRALRESRHARGRHAIAAICAVPHDVRKSELNLLAGVPIDLPRRKQQHDGQDGDEQLCRDDAQEQSADDGSDN